MLSDITTRLFNFLFPETCLGCRKAGTMLCGSCLANVPPPREHMANVLSLFDYQNPLIRRGIHVFKYKNGRRIGVPFGEALYKKIVRELGIGGALFNIKNPVLVPIPLSRERLKKRGFNQSEILVDEILSHDTRQLFRKDFGVLVRKEDTESQVLIRDRDARMENIKGCFSVQGNERILSKTILLIDDVTTTGATIEEARKVLLKAGAERVLGVTVAH